MIADDIKKLIAEEERTALRQYLAAMTKHQEGALKGDAQSIAWVKAQIRPWVQRETSHEPPLALLHVAAAFFLGADDVAPFTPTVLPEDDTDLPDELDIANIAYRMVKNGYGGEAMKSMTFKNRLIACLTERWENLDQSVIDRIATVANPDKNRGRPKKG